MGEVYTYTRAHTHRNKHTDVYYVHAHIDMPTNTQNKTHKNKNAHTHTDSCVIASSGLSLCGENIQELEGLPQRDGEKGQEGGWQKIRKEKGL